MYQSLEPRTEGAIFAKRSKPQYAKELSSRHTRQLEQTGGNRNIQERQEREGELNLGKKKIVSTE